MRKLFLSLPLAAFAALLYADEPKKADDPPAAKKVAPRVPLQPAPKKEVTLKVGDAAPKLAADKWLQGAEVTSFAAGKVTIVEFWATWCGPCIVMMPHMAEMQAEYRDKGVTFIGYSAKDPNNSEEKVTEFVKTRGPKLGYTFAYADSRETYSAWMTAAGQSGIPCCFVVDQAGKIAWIGHPMYLDFVLPKVVAGKFTEADVKAVDEIKKEVSEVFAANRPTTDPEVFLKALGDLNAKHAWTKNIPYFIMPKITKLVKAKKLDEACQAAKEVLAKAARTEDTAMLRSLAFSLRTPDLRDNKDLLAVALQAAQANLKILGDSDFSALSNLMETLVAAGDRTKANDFAARAVAAAKTTSDVSTLLASTAVKDNKELLGRVLKTAEAQINDKDVTWNAYMNVADAHFALGDKSKAKEFGEKAVAASKTPAIKAMVERRVAKFAEEK